MAKPLVIIHGWSDNSKSFEPLSKKLQQFLDRPVKLINLADYISMDDEITFDDLVSAMDKAWDQKSLPRRAASVDAVVHSTGSLIIRDWLCRNFSASATKTNAPIKNMVMLAGANMGSPIAHKGRAFIGRVLKGSGSKKIFQIGENLLRGLELASPYTWNLAKRDRFGSTSLYGQGKILCTVLVGNCGYGGIASVANEEGSDGTVRVSTANMNCAYVTADFSDPLDPVLKITGSKGKTAFRVMEEENHSTIVGKPKHKNKNAATFSYIVDGLKIKDNGFDAWCKQLDDETMKVMKMKKYEKNNYTHGYQNTVFLVRDQFKHHVQDYFMEFEVVDNEKGWFHRDAIRTVHAYCDDKAYRSLLVDCTTLRQQIDNDFEKMKMSLIALPQFKVNKNVGYRTFGGKDIAAIELSKARTIELFRANRTIFAEVILKREQSKSVFQIH